MLNVCGNEHDAIGLKYLKAAQSHLNRKHPDGTRPKGLLVRLHAYLRSQSWVDEQPTRRSCGDKLSPELLFELMTQDSGGPQDASIGESSSSSSSALGALGRTLGSFFGSKGEVAGAGATEGARASDGPARIIPKGLLQVDKLIVCGPPKFERSVLEACEKAGLKGALLIRAMTTGVQLHPSKGL